MDRIQKYTNRTSRETGNLFDAVSEPERDPRPTGERPERHQGAVRRTRRAPARVARRRYETATERYRQSLSVTQCQSPFHPRSAKFVSFVEMALLICLLNVILFRSIPANLVPDLRHRGEELAHAHRVRCMCAPAIIITLSRSDSRSFHHPALYPLRRHASSLE